MSNNTLLIVILMLFAGYMFGNDNYSLCTLIEGNEVKQNKKGWINDNVSLTAPESCYNCAVTDNKVTCGCCDRVGTDIVGDKLKCTEASQYWNPNEEKNQAKRSVEISNCGYKGNKNKDGYDPNKDNSTITYDKKLSKLSFKCKNLKGCVDGKCNTNYGIGYQNKCYNCNQNGNILKCGCCDNKLGNNCTNKNNSSETTLDISSAPSCSFIKTNYIEVDENGNLQFTLCEYNVPMIIGFILFALSLFIAWGIYGRNKNQPQQQLDSQ